MLSSAIWTPMLRGMKMKNPTRRNRQPLKWHRTMWLPGCYMLSKEAVLVPYLTVHMTPDQVHADVLSLIDCSSRLVQVRRHCGDNGDRRLQ
jgi:hypothetical protein